MNYSKGHVLSKIKQLVKSIDPRALIQLEAAPDPLLTEPSPLWNILVITDKQASAEKRLMIEHRLSVLAEEMNQHIVARFTDIQEWKRISRRASVRGKLETFIL